MSAERDPIEPLAVPTVEAARLCGVSVPAWRKLDRSGRCPAPITLGRRLIWRVEELRSWLDQGCPPRSAWKARQWRQERGEMLKVLGTQRGARR